MSLGGIWTQVIGEDILKQLWRNETHIQIHESEHVLSHFSHVPLFETLWTVASVHGDSPGKNTGVGCHSFLQRIFLTQGLNLDLPHCQQILYHLSHGIHKNTVIRCTGRAKISQKLETRAAVIHKRIHWVSYGTLAAGHLYIGWCSLSKDETF